MKKLILAAFVAVAVPVAAQTTTQTVPKTVKTPLVAGVTVAPEAQKRLDAFVEKLKAANALTYRAEASFEDEGKVVKLPVKTLSWLRPDKARVDVAGKEGTVVQSLSDGKTIWFPRSPTEYQTIPIKTGNEKNIARNMVGSTSILSGNLVIAWALQGQSYADFVREAKIEGNVEFSALPATLVNGVNMVGVRVRTLPVESAPTLLGEREQTFWFGATDSLLYRTQERFMRGGKWQTASENYSGYDLNPTFAADTFAFDTTGKKLVTQEDMERTWDARLVVGADPLPFETKDLSGATISPAAMKGKVVLLDFWATWCGPCIGELPNVQKVYDQNKKDGFEIIGISLDEDKKALTDFVAARKMAWPQLFDGKGWNSDIGKQYGVRAIPFTLLIGKDGKIAAINPRGPELETAVKKAMAQTG